MRKWLQPPLPALYVTVWREPQLKEDEFTVWFQDACKPSNRIHNASDRAQRKGADNRIHTTILQRDTLTWQADKFNVQLGFPLLSFRQPEHPRVGFQCIQRLHSCCIVMNEIRAGTCTDLKNMPLSERDNLPANFFDGRWITESIHKMRIDMISIKRHECSSNACGNNSK